MFYIESDNATAVMREAFKLLRDKGTALGKTVDYLDFRFDITDPCKGFPFLKKQHWIWALYEASDRINPEFHNPGESYRFRSNWRKKLLKEQGEFVYSYGDVYICQEQLKYVIKRLRAKQTREAVICLWDWRTAGSKERTPCTLTHHFLIRQDKLYLFTTMRTNDAINLLPYDIWHHTVLQRYIAATLGLGLGTYSHEVHHIYVPKRRITTGIIDRLIVDLDKNTDLYNQLPEEVDPDFDVARLSDDMTIHYLALKAARVGLFNKAIIQAEEIKSLFVREWTQLLVSAESAGRGYEVAIPIVLPEFKFIQDLGYLLNASSAKPIGEESDER